MRGKEAQCKDLETKHTSKNYLTQYSENQFIGHFGILKRM